MASKVIEILPRTSYTFSLPASGSQVIRLSERGFDSVDWKSASIVVLLHSKNFSGSASASASLRVYNTFFDPDNPTVLWQESAGTQLATVSIANGDTAPNLYVSALTGGTIGALVLPVLNYSQGANTGSVSMEISVYINWRED